MESADNVSMQIGRHWGRNDEHGRGLLTTFGTASSASPGGMAGCRIRIPSRSRDRMGRTEGAGWRSSRRDKVALIESEGVRGWIALLRLRSASPTQNVVSSIN